MDLISVAGATSKAGKTTLVCNLLRMLGPQTATAIKFSTNYGKPRGCHLGSPCEVCDLLEGFRVITDPSVIQMHDKDTGRFTNAGARQVIWTIAREYATEEAWSATRRLTGDDALLVIEGSRIVPVARPTLRFYLVHAAIPPKLWKDSAAGMIRNADVVCINTHGDVDVRDGVRETVTMLRGERGFVESDAAQPLHTWLPASTIERLLALNHRA